MPLLHGEVKTMLKNEAETRRAFSQKYDYLNDGEVKLIYDKALATYLEKAFPFDHSYTSVPVDRPRGYQWIFNCMEEIIERNGCSSMTKYAENGLTLEWDSTGVSVGLLAQLVPKAGGFQ